MAPLSRIAPTKFSICSLDAFVCGGKSTASAADAGGMGRNPMAVTAIIAMAKRHMQRNDRNSFIRIAFFPARPHTLS
jgi:hypothetical protein